MANTTAQSLIYKDFHSLESPATIIKFTGGLLSNPAHKAYNMYRKLGLVGRAIPGRDFSSAIGKFDQMSVGIVRFYTKTFKRGRPIAGDDAPIRTTSDLSDRPYDELAVTVFTCPPERVGTAYRNTMIPTTTYVDIVSRIRDWADHFEFEFITVDAAGFRGDTEGYEVYSEAQGNVDEETLSEYDASFKLHNEVNAMQEPSRQLGAWQEGEAMGKGTLDYSAAAKGIDIDTFADIRLWATTRNRAIDGYGFTPADISMPAELAEQGATRPQMDGYFFCVSPRVLNDFVKQEDFKNFQEALATSMGLKQGISSGFAGKYHNVVIAENALCPRFKHSDQSGERFTRGLIWGKMAMAYGYYNRDVPVQWRDRKTGGSWRTATMNTPYQVYINGINKGTDSEVFIRMMFGCKQMRFPVGAAAFGIPSGSTSKTPYGAHEDGHRHKVPNTVSIGLASFDIMEGKHAA